MSSEPSNSPLLVVVAGPTASGKSYLAVRIAQLYGTSVVNADSRQVYQELSIGTAKPTPAEQCGVPHYLFGHVSIFSPYNAAQYEKDALATLADLFATRQLVVVVGGTGLYIKALCEGLDEMPPAFPEIRAALQALWHAEGLSPLQAELQRTDPLYFEQVDRQNPHRLIRALEVIRGTEQPFSSFRTGKQAIRPFRILKIGLNPDRATLHERINQRVDQMMADGLLAEAQALYSHRSLPALQTVGYQEIFDYLGGGISLPQAVEQIKTNTRQYAKRQLTWFRKDDTMQWIAPGDWISAKKLIDHQLSQ